MEWIGEWVRNLAFYFIFLSAVMNFLPNGEEKKYIRFFMGILLILLVMKPVMGLAGLDELLENHVLAKSVSQDYEELLRESARQEIVGAKYVKEACASELKAQVTALAEGLGCQVRDCQVEFFDGEEIELKEIRLELTASGEDGKDMVEMVKNQLEEVYNIPEGNINISIQG